ncbi:hypothetical protein [Geitlerinema sp. PCC 9228]|jgi:hypothetical protein|uniref:hypothetical protein n=1 Tax=Geitlerinema sp. PCC 9228 TaxID=111611 RepID=UPI0008F9871D|nr:hypothetical protein [Geitlerinema sp. PCC 9228]
MSPTIHPLPDAISEIFASASATGILTLSDRYGLMAALLNGELNEEEYKAVNRLFYSINRGRLQVRDRLN